MKGTQLLAWLVENFDQWIFFIFVFIGLVVFVSVIVQKMSPSILIGGIVFVGLVYVLVRELTISQCQRFIRKASKQFADHGEIHTKTNEDALDFVDIAILKLVDSAGGRYTDLIPEANPKFEMSEFFTHVGKMQSMGYLTGHRTKVVLSELGLETVSMPTSGFSASVPWDIATQYARAKTKLTTGDLGGAVDEANKLFEMCLRTRLAKGLWDEKPRKEYERATLGDLLNASRELDLIQSSSLADLVLSSFLKLRTPSKHLTAVESVPLRVAESSVDLARVFLRDWYL
jgi:hypothetical protein